MKSMLRWPGPVALCLLVFATGCDWLIGTPAPQTARVAVGGDAGVQVTLLASTEFLASPVQGVDSTRVELLAADTLQRTVPFDTIYDISEVQRVFVRVLGADSPEASLRLQVQVDGEEKYDQTGTLPERTLQFLYFFNKLATDEVLRF